MAISCQQFPELEFSPETWLLTCLFHDLGTIDKHTHGGFMSFEFYGGMLAQERTQGAQLPRSAG
jgi:cyanamide hydratase